MMDRRDRKLRFLMIVNDEFNFGLLIHEMQSNVFDGTINNFSAEF